jgi:glycosyltransferase involved in cell wall biosynthesis
VLPGWLDGEAKADVLRHASLLALPSYHENFGLCAVEALSRGVPVLVSPHVSLAAEIEASRAGWVCEVSAEALAHTMAEALNDHDERLRRGAAGRALVSKFDWDEIAGMLIELYKSIQTNRPRKTVGPSLSEAASG